MELFCVNCRKKTSSSIGCCPTSNLELFCFLSFQGIHSRKIKSIYLVVGSRRGCQGLISRCLSPSHPCCSCLPRSHHHLEVGLAVSVSHAASSPPPLGMGNEEYVCPGAALNRVTMVFRDMDAFLHGTSGRFLHWTNNFRDGGAVRSHLSQTAGSMLLVGAVSAWFPGYKSREACSLLEAFLFAPRWKMFPWPSPAPCCPWCHAGRWTEFSPSLTVLHI